MGLKIIMSGYVDWIQLDLARGQHGNEPSCYVIDNKFLD
jgi:hypothetical protein